MVLKFLLTDSLLVTKQGEKREWYIKIIVQETKTNFTNKRQMDITCLLIWHPEDTSPVRQFCSKQKHLITSKHKISIPKTRELYFLKNVNVIKEKERLWTYSRLKKSKEIGQLNTLSHPKLGLVLEGGKKKNYKKNYRVIWQNLNINIWMVY